jgi:hypothetical protein
MSEEQAESLSHLSLAGLYRHYSRTPPHDTLSVVLPEFVVAHWWQHFLHNQTALRLKAALLFRPGIVVVNLPQHLEKPVDQG